MLRLPPHPLLGGTGKKGWVGVCPLPGGQGRKAGWERAAWIFRSRCIKIISNGNIGIFVMFFHKWSYLDLLGFCVPVVTSMLLSTGGPHPRRLKCMDLDRTCNSQAFNTPGSGSSERTYYFIHVVKNVFQSRSISGVAAVSHACQ